MSVRIKNRSALGATILKSKIIRYGIVPAILIAVLGWWFFAGNKIGIKTARAGYLKLTETSDYFHIQSDAYGIRIYKTSSDSYVQYYNASSTEIANTTVGLQTPDYTVYEAVRDTNRTVQLIENSPNRIVIKIKGKFDETYGATSNYLTDGTDNIEYTAYYYIYPEYFNYKIDINAYNGVNLINNYAGSPIFRLRQESGYFDSGKRYYGTSTGEALASNYGVYESAQYGAVLATSTVDWQVVKLSENHSGTSTFAFSFSTESTKQIVCAILNNGNLKGEASASLTVRPWTDSTAEQRRAWAAAMIGTDAPSLSVGAATKDWENEIFEPFSADGSYHLTADNNKVKFTLHGEADAYATLAATNTGGDTSLSITGDSGLADGGGTTTHWVQLGNRLPYGSFDANDPDVLFYWDMNSTTTGQAPNKGVGPIDKVNSPCSVATGTAGNGISFGTSGAPFRIGKSNINPSQGSLGFWYIPNSATSSQYRGFVTDTGGPDYFGVGIDSVSNGNKLFFNYNGGAYLYSDDLVWNPEQAYYIKVTWTLTERKIYRDGKLLIKSTFQKSAPPISVLGIGSAYGAQGADGIMDEFYISQDPDQPDGPSYYDVVSYTDKNGSSLTGIPHLCQGSGGQASAGYGCIKWNHEPGVPVAQTTKPTPVFTIHDWHPKTKSSTTGEFVDHLVLDLPLNKIGSNENVNKVYDKASGSWIGTTSAGVTFEQAVQGNGARFDEDNDFITTPVTSSMDFTKGTIECWVKPEHTHDLGANYYILMIPNFVNNQIYLRYSGFNGRRRFEFSVKGDSVTSALWATQSEWYYGNNQKLQQWHHIIAGWDTAKDFSFIKVDGELFMGTGDTNLWAGNQTEFYLGASDAQGGEYYPGIIDNFRIYNDEILPYGAYYTGYEANGDYAHKHPDVKFYWRMNDLTNGQNPQIGTGTVTVVGPPALVTGVDGTASSAMQFATSSYAVYDVSNLGDKNAFSLWVKPNWDDTDTNFRLILGQDAYNGFRFMKKETAGEWEWSVRDDSGVYHYCSWNMDWNAGEWLHFYLWYDTTATSGEYNLGVKVNGVEPSLTYYNGTGLITISSWNTITGRVGGYNNDCDCVIDELYITNDPTTPQIPTAYGKPIIAPQLVLVETNGNSLKTMETDYDVAMLNDITSWLVKYNADVDTETTFLITETLNPPSLAATDENLDRVAPLLSVSYTSGYAEITVQRGDGSWADDFKLIFKEADAGVSECYLGQGTAGSWGSNLCGATDMLTEISQNSVAQEDQTSTLNLVQSTGAEVIVRNYFTLGDEATTTEDWHIFSNGVVIKETNYTKGNGSNESRIVNSNFTNWTYYPATPSVSRGAGVYYDSFLLHLTSVNTDVQNDYLNPNIGATSTIGGFLADASADIDADGYAEGRGTYVLTANYQGDPSVPQCPGTCGQPIYHTIGTSTATISATGTAVNQISADFWLVQFSSPLDLSGIHKHDKFHDSAGNDWNIVLVDDTNDAVVVGNQEKNSGSPATGAGTLGPWYNSLYAWEAAEQRDLTATTRYANGEIEMAECWPLRDTTAVDIDGWTTGENNFIKIYTPLSARHRGKWDEEKYIFDVNTVNNHMFWVKEQYTVIDGLQFTGSSGESLLMFEGGQGGNHGRVKNCIFKDHQNIDTDKGFIYTWDAVDIIIANCIIYGGTNNQNAIKNGGSTTGTKVYNTTIYNMPGTGINFATGVNNIAKNNIVQNCGIAYSGTFDASSDYNIADDGTAPGAHSKNCTVSFVSTSTNDFHLASDDTCAQGAGWNLSSDSNLAFSTDIDGEPRSSASSEWDIGADQVRDKWLNKVKFTFDASAQTIYQPRFLLEDFYPQSGKNGSEESYVVLDLPLDETGDSSNVYNKITGTATGTFSGNVSFIPAIRGRGAKFINNNDAIILDSPGIGDEITVEFDYQRTATSVNSYAAFFNGKNSGGSFSFLMINSGSGMLFGASTGNDWLFSQAWINYLSDYNWWHVKLVTDYENFATLYLNDVIIKGVKSNNPSWQPYNQIYIGNNYLASSHQCGGIIDNFKIYNNLILPYGAYYTGYEQNGNYSSADPTLTFYWDAESEKARGGVGLSKEITGTAQSNPQLTDSKSIYGNKSLYIPGTGRVYTFDVSNGDLFDKSQGSIGFWFYPTTSALNALFMAYIDSNNSFVITEKDSGGSAFLEVDWRAQGSTVSLSIGDIVVGAWNWVKVTWDTYADELKLFVNGKQSGSTATISNDLQGNIVNIQIGDATYDWASPYYLDQIFITNSPYSQEIPTAFGKPLRAPLMKVDGTRQKFGYDYIVSWTPDPSAVIVQYFKNVTGTTFEIGEGEGTAQTIRLRGGIRLEGGVRF